jgi:hypothetical protein
MRGLIHSKHELVHIDTRLRSISELLPPVFEFHFILNIIMVMPLTPY